MATKLILFFFFFSLCSVPSASSDGPVMSCCSSRIGSWLLYITGWVIRMRLIQQTDVHTSSAILGNAVRCRCENDAVLFQAPNCRDLPFAVHTNTNRVRAVKYILGTHHVDCRANNTKARLVQKILIVGYTSTWKVRPLKKRNLRTLMVSFHCKIRWLAKYVIWPPC